MKIKITLAFALLLFTSLTIGQIKEYSYKRELLGIQDQWHKIILPEEIFGKLSPELSDLRIFGITKNKDTIEAPYILQIASEKTLQKEVAINLINQSKNSNGYYFTFEIPLENSVNQIQFEFKEQNFDWRLVLEGSQDQKEWFSILEDYRILSIKNELTDFHFTKVNFTNSKYHYLRVLIKSKKDPELIVAKISSNQIVNGSIRNYTIHSTKIENEKQNKQTLIYLDLNTLVPISKVKLFVNDSFDYYRPVTIEYLTDSIKTQQGWKYNYGILTSGTLNSFEKNEFVFKSTILKELKITIENQDNKPLHFDSLQVKGYVYELIARFIDPATYYLSYGKNEDEKPIYDLDRFAEIIPNTMTQLNLGEEQLIDKESVKKIEPLFQNKIWLWMLMAIIIVLLGWFSLKMIKQKS